MSYIGSTPTTQSFIAGTDYFNGNGSTVNFTLSRSVNSVNDIEVIVNNVEQIPSGYSVSGTTLTFSAAPSAGTSNVYVRYLSTTNLSLAIPAGTSATFNTVTVADGSATTPSITNDGDTNTGIFFPAADTIAFAEGGVEAARFDSAGNMGLGATPSAWGSNNRTIDMYGIGSFSSFSNGAGGYELDVGLNAYNSASGWRYKVSSYAVALYQQAAGSHIWYNAAAGTAGNAISFTQAMTLDSSGNVGIGTSSPAYRVDVGTGSVAGNIHTYGSITSGTLAGYSIRGIPRLTNDTGTFENTYIGCGASAGNIIFQQGNSFTTASNTERARITAAGEFVVGTTTTYGINTVARSNNGYTYASLSVSNQADHFIFKSDGTTVGSINRVGGTGVIYNTSSDYRLKEAIAPMTGALAKVALLKPCTYKWKVDGSDGQGFIAHELQAVIPDAVSGEKDAVEEDGSIKPQGIDQSRIVATLTAAIQEQQALITALTTRITALENNNATQ